MSDVVKKRPGNPNFLPHLVTEDARQLVRVLAANGIAQRIIADNVGIPIATLKRHYKKELTDGLERVEAAMGAAIVKAAMNGNWGAAKYWLCANAKDNRWREANKELKEADAYASAVAASADEVVHFYMPPNHRDEPDEDEQITIDGVADAA